MTNRNWGALIGQVLRTVLGVLGGRQRSPVSPPRNEPQRARATLRSAPRPGASTGNASGSSSTAAPTHPDRRGTGHPESPGQAPSPGQFGPAATIERDPHRVKSLRVSYDPQRDGAPDAGEVIWTWVPYAENDGRGKDRPVLVIGRESRERVYAVKLTSKPRDGERDFLSIGAGPWDSQGRESWVDVDQLYSVHVDGMRREAAVLDRDRFDRVAALLVRRFGWQT